MMIGDLSLQWLSTVLLHYLFSSIRKKFNHFENFSLKIASITENLFGDRNKFMTQKYSQTKKTGI